MYFLSVLSAMFCFFFFQAEDGIRDTSVTGVQTCALPIWARHSVRAAALSKNPPVFRACPGKRRARSDAPYPADESGGGAALRRSVTTRLTRSEERRVGKECTCRVSH